MELSRDNDPPEEDVLFSEDTFVIREVFSIQTMKSSSGEDASALGGSFEELCDDYDNMTEAFNKPILLLTEDEDGIPALVELDEEEE